MIVLSEVKSIFVRKEQFHTKTSTKDTNWIILDLTLLNSEPLMYVVLIWGTIVKTDYYPGIDMLAEKFGKESNADFYEKNSGLGKLFPGSPLFIV